MAVVRAALQAVDTGALVRAALETPEVMRAVRSAAAVDLVAVGKAALPMLLASAVWEVQVWPHLLRAVSPAA